ncbi:TA system VapC family ribonuclease toxin [Aquipuribacter nitratireducens]|uniref:Ribonuclease VapC n=1 Tax=Aquipuribacter nitratireducens TaxID=650104 RepID=A0ABW0GHR7_9MICO
MRLVDANVLLYAVNSDTDHHDASRRWLDEALSGRDTVGFAWVALLAFLRLSTKAGLFPSPLAVDDAFDRVDAWLASPSAVLVRPGPEHGRVLRSLLERAGTGGNLVNDAHLAALALEQKATVVSYDDDFGRFPGVRWQRPA